jgi:hypothetical protein
MTVPRILVCHGVCSLIDACPGLPSGVFICPPLRGSVQVHFATHGLRRGLYSFAALRLGAKRAFR